MIRAVLDANVIVSGVLTPHGHSGSILQAWREDLFRLVVSDYIVSEVHRVLLYPKLIRRHGLSRDEIAELALSLGSVGMRTPGRLSIGRVCDDPNDDPYLVCALEGRASYVVSGDDDLLRLSSFQGVNIVAPKRFIELLSR